ncbi:MAG: hypothetical protein ACKPKO_34450, partial [Candidatus Fonsibacter sp.]
SCRRQTCVGTVPKQISTMLRYNLREWGTFPSHTRISNSECLWETFPYQMKMMLEFHFHAENDPKQSAESKH